MSGIVSITSDGAALIWLLVGAAGIGGCVSRLGPIRIRVNARTRRRSLAISIELGSGSEECRTRSGRESREYL